MIKNNIFILIILFNLCIITYIKSECPNACSGHGDCTNFDQCNCHRNWMGGDCSQRICPFGRAHVDSPKGDLDGSGGSLSGADTTVVTGSDLYPLGTQELYPNMTDSAGVALTNTAHDYMECSNKGLCDRDSGECICFPGYSGSGCERVGCPDNCNGHGVCQTIQEKAADDFDNEYNLWDKESSMICSCDSGYSGTACQIRDCPYGLDPLYIDDEDITARVPTWSFQISDDAAGTVSGTYGITFYDINGEAFTTSAITWDSTTFSTCSDIVTALEGLPNDLIGENKVLCDQIGSTYTLKFPDNPGYHRQIEIDAYLDGSTSTLTASAGNVDIDIWQEGISGENTDFFYQQCDGVTATMTTLVGTALPGRVGTLVIDDVDSSGDNTAEIKLFKQCLGDSNGNTDDNVDVENWDHGSYFEKDAGDVKVYLPGSFPHAIKLVSSSPINDHDGGHFHLIWFNDDDDTFYLMNQGNATDDTYNIFTTDGIVEMIATDTDGDNVLTSNKGEVAITGRFTQHTNTIYTNVDASCNTGASTLTGCLEKGDWIFVPDANYGTSTSNYTQDTGFQVNGASTNDNTGNLYKITRIWVEDQTADTKLTAEDRFRITVDKNFGWDGSTTADLNGDNFNEGIVRILKFTSDSNSNYEYVSECSNRGVCNDDTGVCECFDGYTNNNCDTVNALARSTISSSKSSK